MSPKAFHATLTLFVGVSVGFVWLRVFWNNVGPVPRIVLAMPFAVAVVGLSHWVAYDFSIGHWAGDFSLIQAVFNVSVAMALLARRARDRNHVLR